MTDEPQSLDMLIEPDFSFDEQQREAWIERAKEAVERELRDDYRWAALMAELQDARQVVISITITPDPQK